MAKILYIHGFMSSPNSGTIKNLRQRFGRADEIFTPEVDGDPDRSLTIINEMIERKHPRIIVGSSLGGFYALACNSGNAFVYSINPVTNPTEEMKHFLNQRLPYLQKRIDKATHYTLTDETLTKFAKYNVEEIIRSKEGKVYGLLSDRDELLGDSHIQLFTKIFGYPSPFVTITDLFGHRIGGDKQSLNLIYNEIDQILQP